MKKLIFLSLVIVGCLPAPKQKPQIKQLDRVLIKEDYDTYWFKATVIESNNNMCKLSYKRWGKNQHIWVECDKVKLLAEIQTDKEKG